MPITIELSLVYEATDHIVSKFDARAANAGFAAANASTTWQIQNVHAKCDLTALYIVASMSHISNLLEEGKKLTLNYNTFISQYQTILNQTDFSINISRS